jgi:hypothetical protein
MRTLSLIIITSIFWNCNVLNDPWSPEYNASEWLIDEEFIQSGCFAGKDCIPSLENPNKSNINGPYLDFLKDDDLVVGIFNGQDYIAYPHDILAWHEVINENGYSVSFCPLTNSALHFATENEFGVSGLLYNANLIMYDRQTDSYWPQMYLKAAAGKRQGEELILNSMVETRWATWKALFPDTKVVNSNTNYSDIYSEFGYGYDKLSDEKAASGYVPVPLAQIDERLPIRAKVLSVISNNSVTSFVISDFTQPTVINQSINGEQINIIISGPDNIAVAFASETPLTISSWDISTGVLILEAAGQEYNILGHGISKQLQLPYAKSFISDWFAVAAIYNNINIYKP